MADDNLEEDIFKVHRSETADREVDEPSLDGINDEVRGTHGGGDGIIQTHFEILMNEINEDTAWV